MHQTTRTARVNGTIRQEKRIVMNRTLDVVVDSGSVGGLGVVVVVAMGVFVVAMVLVVVAIVVVVAMVVLVVAILLVVVAMVVLVPVEVAMVLYRL